MSDLITETDQSGAEVSPGGRHSDETTAACVLPTPAINAMVVISLPSAACFPVVISKQDRPTLPKGAMLAYELEDLLPVDGDDLAVDTIESPQSWLAIATNAANHRHVAEQQEQRGLHVRAIVPEVFLAVGAAIREQRLPKNCLLFWSNDDGVEFIDIQSGRPASWRWLSECNDTLRQTLDSLTDKETRPVIMVACDESTASLLESTFTATDRYEWNMRELAASEAARIAEGSVKPMIDLRQGALSTSNPYFPIRRSLALFSAMFLLMQIAVVGAVFWRGHQYQTLSDDVLSQQEEVFQRVFPGERIPVGILSRLESEHRTLSGTRGVHEKKIPRLTSVVPISHVLLSTLPDSDKARYRIDWIEILPNTISLNGAARSYDDLEAIAESMRSGGLDCPPVSATKTSEGVSLRLDDITLASDGDSK